MTSESAEQQHEPADDAGASNGEPPRSTYVTAKRYADAVPDDAAAERAHQGPDDAEDEGGALAGVSGDEVHGRDYAPTNGRVFDPELARLQAGVAPDVHEILDSDGPMPSDELKAKVARRVLAIGCTAGFERVVDPDSGRVCRYAVVRTGRGDLRWPVGPAGWEAAFRRIGVDLDA